MRYRLQFGSINTGKTVTFTYFRNADTEAAVAQPAITERGSGEYSFEWDWTLTTATRIVFLATFTSGPEIFGEITSDSTNITSSGVATGGPAATPWLWTAGQIINQAAVECGLSEVVDPYSSTDAHFIRLRVLLKTVGLELLKARDWQMLVKECTVTGDGTTTTFNLPSDHLRMKSDSQFNRSNQWPTGLVHSPGWQALKATALSSTIRTLYREIQGRIEFYQAPALNAVVAWDYVSRFWAKTSGAAAADLYQPSASGDTVMFEPDLAAKALKAKFLLATNQDATGALDEYARAYEAAAGTEPAQVLSLNGGSDVYRHVDEYNFPITGWGI